MVKAHATTSGEATTAPESGTSLRAAATTDDEATIVSDLADDDVIGPLLPVFAEVLPEMMAELTRHSASGARADLCKAAHQLKGSGGAYGYGVLTTMAAELEKRAKGDAPDDELVRRVGEIAAVARRVLRGIPPAP